MYSLKINEVHRKRAQILVENLRNEISVKERVGGSMKRTLQVI